MRWNSMTEALMLAAMATDALLLADVTCSLGRYVSCLYLRLRAV